MLSETCTYQTLTIHIQTIKVLMLTPARRLPSSSPSLSLYVVNLPCLAVQVQSHGCKAQPKPTSDRTQQRYKGAYAHYFTAMCNNISIQTLDTINNGKIGFFQQLTAKGPLLRIHVFARFEKYLLSKEKSAGFFAGFTFTTPTSNRR